MGRPLVVSSVVVVSMVLGAGGCRQSITGSLTVAQPLFIKSSAGVRHFPAGQYPVRVAANGDELTLRIEHSKGDVITAELETSAQPDATAMSRIPAARSGQPFDILYKLSSHKSEAATAPDIVGSCEVDTVETICRNVMDTDFLTGHQQLREVCDTVRVSRSGTRKTSSVRELSTTSLIGHLLDPVSGQVLGQLMARAERSRNDTIVTPCVENARIR